MALRNAFDLLGTESTLRKILSAVTFAKSSSDQLRVVTDSGSTVAVSSGTISVFGANVNGVVGATNVAPYAGTSWNDHDIREQYQVQTQQNFMITRNRWTIT